MRAEGIDIVENARQPKTESRSQGIKLKTWRPESPINATSITIYQQKPKYTEICDEREREHTQLAPMLHEQDGYLCTLPIEDFGACAAARQEHLQALILLGQGVDGPRGLPLIREENPTAAQQACRSPSAPLMEAEDSRRERRRIDSNG